MRVLMTWEQGAGWGHIGRLAPVARGLLLRGHEVVLAVRNPERTAPRVAGARVLPLPARGEAPAAPLALPATFPDILHNIGWHSDTELERLASAWLDLIDRTAPEVLVMDYSPTALLAAQARVLPRVLLSTGFSSPPDVTPLPSLLPTRDPVPSAESVAREAAILERANRLLHARGVAPLDRLAQLFTRVDLNVLATWPELDHYGERHGARYAGVWTDTLGERPDWPTGHGPKVFVYLKAFPALGALLHMLNRSELPVLAYLTGAGDEVRARATADSVRVVEEPVDLPWAAGQSELAVLNAGHGATAVMLLAGTPLLEIPLLVEQFHVARRVVEMGAGQVASADSPEQIGQGLRRLLTDGRFTRGAARFKERHRGFDGRKTVQRVVDRIAAFG